MHHFRDLEGEVKARELSSLQEELWKPGAITGDRLQEWAGDSADRKTILSGTIWGGIRWAMALGRPKGPTLAVGFDIVHECLNENFKVGRGGKIGEGTWKIQTAPAVWDAPPELDVFRVGFMFFSPYFFTNRVLVHLTDVPWDRELGLLRGYRRLSATEFPPFRNLGEMVVLPDLEVRHIRLTELATVQALNRYADAGPYGK